MYTWDAKTCKISSSCRVHDVEQPCSQPCSQEDNAPPPDMHTLDPKPQSLNLKTLDPNPKSTSEKKSSHTFSNKTVGSCQGSAFHLWAPCTAGRAVRPDRYTYDSEAFVSPVENP